jgi:CheY-like chemotaxis protein
MVYSPQLHIAPSAIEASRKASAWGDYDRASDGGIGGTHAAGIRSLIDGESAVNATKHHTTIQPIEMYLKSGMTTVIALHPCPKDALRTRANLRGWRENAYLALDLPTSGEFVEGLWKEMPLVVRFFSSGIAGGFHTSVLSWHMGNGPDLLYVSWPESYEAVPVRKADRVDVRIPCRIWRDDPSIAEASELVDISETGCGIATIGDFASGGIITVAFSIPDGRTIAPMKCSVQNVRTRETRNVLGCQFGSVNPADRAAIAYYVSSIQDRLCVISIPRILIVDSHPEELTPLVKCLESNGFDVVIAPGTIDGAYRLRLVRPEAVLVNDEIELMRGIDFCRIISKTEGLEGIPIFVYGQSDDNLPALAKEARLTGCFPSAAKTDMILREIQKALREP